MSDTGDQVFDHLPVFSDVTPESRWERLRVQGLVERPLQLVPTAVSGLPVLLGISNHVRRLVYPDGTPIGQGLVEDVPETPVSHPSHRVRYSVLPCQRTSIGPGR